MMKKKSAASLLKPVISLPPSLTRGERCWFIVLKEKSRSATVVIAYLMMRNLTLSESWNTLKKMHRRLQPNDEFARASLELDLRLHGKVSMDWQHKKPVMKVCPICGKNAGMSKNSLKLHPQKPHKRISSGSVDSGSTIEALKVFEDLKLSSTVTNNAIQVKFSSLSPKFPKF